MGGVQACIVRRLDGGLTYGQLALPKYYDCPIPKRGLEIKLMIFVTCRQGEHFYDAMLLSSMSFQSPHPQVSRASRRVTSKSEYSGLATLLCHRLSVNTLDTIAVRKRGEIWKLNARNGVILLLRVPRVCDFHAFDAIRRFLSTAANGEQPKVYLTALDFVIA